jgi:hypothetical protein
VGTLVGSDAKKSVCPTTAGIAVPGWQNHSPAPLIANTTNTAIHWRICFCI